MKKTRLLVLLGTLLVLGLFLVGCEESVEPVPMGSIPIQISVDNDLHTYKISWVNQADADATVHYILATDHDGDITTPELTLNTAYFSSNSWRFVLETLNVGTYDITVTKYTSQDEGEDIADPQTISNVVIAEGENPTLTFDFSI
ncbi:hypothetical protein SDC9_47058 [bioreactor metagenome]|uniref:Uncharacterized protein n=1 Tax=bioreactor metagenome TaxID=1076179 RepID=A0A644WAJ9_9ZZZZ|nr:hypothetical protein [Sphaerochaeta sp.]